MAGTVFACVDWFCELCRNWFASKNASCLRDCSNTKRTLYSCHWCNKLCSKTMLRELWRKSCGGWHYLQLADSAKIGKETMKLQSLTKRWRVYAPIVVKLLRSLFHAFTLFCTANNIGSCITQPKIARIISIVSGVLWWQYATYASPCIMTKASSGYHMWCSHFMCHILKSVWLLALSKADWGKVCPGRSRVCSWTVVSLSI